jgi:hypothetical protein
MSIHPPGFATRQHLSDCSSHVLEMMCLQSRTDNVELIPFEGPLLCWHLLRLNDEISLSGQPPRGS